MNTTTHDNFNEGNPIKMIRSTCIACGVIYGMAAVAFLAWILH